MPPVELRGFSGKVEKTSHGLRWTVKLGELYGSISAYVVPGATPFLLSSCDGEHRGHGPRQRPFAPADLPSSR